MVVRWGRRADEKRRDEFRLGVRAGAVVPAVSGRAGEREALAVALTVTETGHGDWAVLRVSGELDLVTAPTLRGRVHDVVAEGRHRLVLDLSGVFFCDSSGVGVLIAARRLIRSCRGRLRLILPAHGTEEGSHVNRVLAALGVRRLFDVYPDVTVALMDDADPLSA
ncbi:anti-anti-sigma factor [Streptomyces griseoaurantiacus]|jgi:anti-anti-sigma factor|uniref:Anti-sigma factor antagonist n=2 Tax=Streptomyces griseoaurantiacus TaxID=68213 RepID=A0A1G7NC71_9ACTN|nr:STAS domain-containing protein [Streptomyces griseoaurantiacus]SDF71572.1 anti-anti-sigma factor [Streptomyces jietaisiensis]